MILLYFFYYYSSYVNYSFNIAHFNYLLTYDSYVPLYNRFHRGEWITRVCVQGPLPPLTQVIHSPL